MKDSYIPQDSIYTRSPPGLMPNPSFRDSPVLSVLRVSPKDADCPVDLLPVIELYNLEARRTAIFIEFSLLQGD